MIREERELLARLMTANQGMGEVVRRMLDRLGEGALNPEELRLLGRQLALLGADMVRHADRVQRGRPLVEQPPIAVPRSAWPGDTLPMVIRDA